MMKSIVVALMVLLVEVNFTYAMSDTPQERFEGESNRGCQMSAVDYLDRDRYPTCSETSQFSRSVSVPRISDAQFKENQQPLIGTLSRLENVPLYQFNYLGQPTVHYGVMAQELQQYFPELISQQSVTSGVFQDNIHPGALQVDYLGLGIIAIQALKEANQKIKTLESRIIDLESKHY
jgi:hypothetical protein